MSRFSSVSELLDELAPDVPAEAAWEDVLARAESLATIPSNGRMSTPHSLTPTRRRRGYVLAGLALVGLVVAVVAAAYALGHPVIKFGEAPRASSRTVVNFFGRMTVGVPKGIPVLPHQARRITDVRIEGRDHALLIAPMKQGGFCYAWSGSVNGCQLPGEPRYLNISGTLSGDSGAEPLDTIGGSFPQARTARIVLAFADGQTADIPFVWVTEPIGSGFFLFGIPNAHRRHGHQAVRITLFDSSGRLITSQRVSGIVLPSRRVPYRLVRHRLAGYPPLMVPAPAEWANRHQLFNWRADAGIRIGLWIAPARDGGTCYWSNIHTGCSGTQTYADWPKIRPGKGYVSLCCTIARDAARVEVFFEDGDRVTLRPKDGYLIWPIPRRHYPPDHRLDKLVTYNKRGAEIGTLDVPTNIRALYPCSKPRNYGYGLVMCP